MKNYILLIGRLTKDIELRSTMSGTDVIRFSIAVNRDYKNKSGDYETDFISILAYGNIAKLMNEYCHKGDLISVSGKIQSGSYEKDGKKHYTQNIIATNISFLANKNQKNNDDSDSENIVMESQDPFEDFGNEVQLSDDDLPF